MRPKYKKDEPVIELLTSPDDFKNIPDCFGEVRREQWESWQWQKANSFVVNYADSIEMKKATMKKISDAVGLPVENYQELETTLKIWNVLITPHQILQIRHKIIQGDKESALALFKTVNPSVLESQHQQKVIQIKIDGTGVGYRKEERYSTPENPEPKSIKRLYDDRIILAPTLECATLCRYCFRRAEAGRIKEINWQEGIDYIRKWNSAHQKSEQIRDVILSGGDPLSLPDEKIKNLLGQAKTIPGVKFLRLDTKYPVAMPQRITPELTKILGDYVDYMYLHFTHPAEISPETKKVCLRLAEKNIMLGSYTPLLKGINDSRETLKNLFWSLLAECRVRPYYLVHFIETLGAQHFKAPLEKAVKLLDGLQTKLSGPAVPPLVLYLPGGGEKYVFGVNRSPIKRTRGGYWIPSPLHNGKPMLYPDPIPENERFGEFEF